MSHTIMELNNVSKKYRTNSVWSGKKELLAVSDIQLKIQSGHTLGIVGESGSGKSTLGRIVAGLDKPSSGQIIYQGVSARDFTRRDKEWFRREVQVIFQDPVAALNPRMSVFEILAEPFYLQNREVYKRKNELRERIEKMLIEVELSTDLMDRKPRQLSGGQCQRIGIARAFAMQPKILVLDESLSALDQLVQKTILILLKEFQERYNTSYLFITHNLRLAVHLSDEMAIMNQGRIVEHGDAAHIMSKSTHPVVKRLKGAVLTNLQNRFLRVGVRD